MMLGLIAIANLLVQQQPMRANAWLVRGVGDIETRNRKLSVENVPVTGAPLGDEARRQLDSAIAITRRASYWRDTVSWPSVESDVRAFAVGAQTAADTYPAIRELLMRLGDHHSFSCPRSR